MVKSIVSKLSLASSNLSLPSTISSASSSSVVLSTQQHDSHYAKNRSDPGRFFGDGVQFKAKLIGILEVGEARGDRMCQEALQDLKMAIRAAGEHKQRITIHVTIDGLRLRDEKTGDSLYHHPVHKISFIAQDMTDSRAFGYIFGSPDSGHRFFGIKTDKAASQVVLAMRDLFQVVFELKKKEIELARQQIQSKTIHEHQAISASSAGGSSSMKNNLSVFGTIDSGNITVTTAGGISLLGGASSNSSKLSTGISGGGADGGCGKAASVSNIKEMSPESVADLVDLEQELSSLQRGITQMERITPNEPAVVKGAGGIGNEEDPFGDSFTNFPTYNLLPPPESTRSRAKPPTKTPDSGNNNLGYKSNTNNNNNNNNNNSSNTASGGYNSSTNTSNLQQISLLLSNSTVNSSRTTGSPIICHKQREDDDDDHWLNDLEQNDVFDTSKAGMGYGMGLLSAGGGGISSSPLAPSELSSSTPTGNSTNATDVQSTVVITTTTGASGNIDAIGQSKQHPIQSISDLDPLGTGRTRPYVDKKYFFHELKNPPKKVLKDLSTSSSSSVCGGEINLFSTGNEAASGVSDSMFNDDTSTSTAHIMDATSSVSVDQLQSTSSAAVEQFNQLPSTGMLLMTTTSASTMGMTTAGGSGSITTMTASSSSSVGSIVSTNAATSTTATTSAGPANANDPVMLPRDTDPFSPTRKKSDPFNDGDIFSKLDPFEFEFPSTSPASTNVIAGNRTTSVPSSEVRQKAEAFNGPLQVSLPPESGWSTATSITNISSGESPANDDRQQQQQRRYDRQTSESPTAVGFGTSSVINRNRPSSGFKQNTVDVISSISSKKMPHLFGQKFSKRDSNSINMRRLQESDSLSENEAAPEPPPRPDSASHSLEPPPLPPKKQFSDIIIRPRAISASSSILSANNRYEFVTKTIATSGGGNAPSTRRGDVPPIPLPSRRVGRSDGTYPGPGRPRKPGQTNIDMEGDYLTPIGSNISSIGVDVPPLLPPPSQPSRGRTGRQRQEIYENKTEIEQQQQQQQQQQLEAQSSSILPDITLSQLLTLGIDELAAKLNVPTTKLSTMTLVELTSYLSEYIEKSSAKPIHIRPKTRSASSLQNNESSSSSAAIFKVSFDRMTGSGSDDHGSDATFIAKFDDNFGEDPCSDGVPFIANFSQFDPKPLQTQTCSPASTAAAAATSTKVAAIPPADRYAVFREIIDQEMQQENIIDLKDSSPENDVEDGVADAGFCPAYSGSETKSQKICPSTTNIDDIIAGMSLSTTQFSDDDNDIGVSDIANDDSHSVAVPKKIDTKITEAISHAKDRYAALRDIILVEDLFEKKSTAVITTPPRPPSEGLMHEFPEFSDEFNSNAEDDLNIIEDDDKSRKSRTATCRTDDGVESRGAATSSALTVEDESSPESNQNEEYEEDYQQLPSQQLHHLQQPSPVPISTSKQDTKFLHPLTASKDDLEINELMNRAISNLSLDSREHLSPNNAVSTAAAIEGASLSSSPQMRRTSPISTSASTAASITMKTSLQFNDVSTSPIPLQKSPGMLHQQPKTSPLAISPTKQQSPIPVQLAAVSNLIDSATRHLNSTSSLSDIAIVVGSSPNTDLIDVKQESWAVFDSKGEVSDEKMRRDHRRHHQQQQQQQQQQQRLKSPKVTSLNLPPPPTPPSNISSREDPADSPCSSDGREVDWKGREFENKRWPKGTGSGGADMVSGGVGGCGGGGQHTSSSSRDLSPWDDEGTSDYKKRLPPPGTDRHGYYTRHARRMNSCDEDYEYEEEFSKRRDHRKIKTGISRSRDNFEFDSPSWYHTGGHHHTWSPQDEDGSRPRSFDRSAYERTTYGPPAYDKRDHKVNLPPPPQPPHSSSSTYDRRGGYDKRKYYREFSRSNYDFDVYGESPQSLDKERHKMYDVGGGGNFEKMKSMGSGTSVLGGRRDYENVYSYKSRGEYVHERDRRSFDRESLESYESASRRRRSFGSGDVYGSLESREDFRDRYISGPEKSRSLRKSVKMRTTGDIDYEQDSENDFQQHMRRGGSGINIDTRSLQRAGQSGGGGGQQRMRKSSGSSPWDGEDPPYPIGSGTGGSGSTAQKPWKRPSSASESERRLAESRRVAALGQTPSGSDGEKDRRFRKKQRSRVKDVPASCIGVPRYAAAGSTHTRDNYDYVTYDDDEDYDETPTDEDKFERLNRRRHDMHQRMMEGTERDRRQQQLPFSGGKIFPPSLKSTSITASKPQQLQQQKQQQHSSRSDFDFDDFEETPRSNASGSGGNGNKFNFEEHGGFESDFNQSSPPHHGSCDSTPAPTNTSIATTPATKSSFRFSNDFSDKDKLHHHHHQNQHQHHQQLQQQQQKQQHHHQSTHSLMMTSSTSGGNFDTPELSTPNSAVVVPSPTYGGPPQPPITQKLRFDDNVTISKFDNDQPSSTFEDDFSKAEFDFEKEDQWNAQPLSIMNNNNNNSCNNNSVTMPPKKNNLRCLNNKLQQRQDLIKKSESINIFAKKTEDPFEDDEFFKSPPLATGMSGGAGVGNTAQGSDTTNGKQKIEQDDGDTVSFQWDNNFAKFDENM